jgi:hypothetical protein
VRRCCLPCANSEVTTTNDRLLDGRQVVTAANTYFPTTI